MSGETETRPSGWTVDTLMAHYDRRLNDMQRLLDERYAAQQREVQTALTSAEKAVGKVELATEKRFESVNEFRAQLSDQTNSFLPREVADTTFAELRTQIGMIASRLDRTDGGTVERRESRQGLSQNATIVLAVVAIVVTVLVANGTFN